MDSPGGFANFDYAFQAAPVTVSPTQLAATLQSTRSAITYTEPAAPVFPLEAANAGTIAQRRAQKASEKNELYAMWSQPVVFREVSFQQSASSVGIDKADVSPRTMVF